MFDKAPVVLALRPIMIYSNIVQWHSHRLHAWNRNMYQPYDLKYIPDVAKTWVNLPSIQHLQYENLWSFICDPCSKHVQHLTCRLPLPAPCRGLITGPDEIPRWLRQQGTTFLVPRKRSNQHIYIYILYIYMHIDILLYMYMYIHIFLYLFTYLCIQYTIYVGKLYTI